MEESTTIKKKKSPVDYVDNNRLYAELCDYYYKKKEAAEKGLTKPRASDFVGEAITKIAEKYTSRPCFVGYSYRDEMIVDGIYNCAVYGVENFHPDKSNKPFAYFTKIIHYAALNRIRLEKREQATKYKNLKRLASFGDEEFDYKDEMAVGDTLIESYEKSIEKKKLTKDN